MNVIENEFHFLLVCPKMQWISNVFLHITIMANSMEIWNANVSNITKSIKHIGHTVHLLFIYCETLPN